MMKIRNAMQLQADFFGSAGSFLARIFTGWQGLVRALMLFNILGIFTILAAQTRAEPVVFDQVAVPAVSQAPGISRDADAR